MSKIRFSAFLLHKQIVWLLLSKKYYPHYWYVRSKLTKNCIFFDPLLIWVKLWFSSALKKSVWMWLMSHHLQAQFAWWSKYSLSFNVFLHPCLETSCKSRKNWLVQIVWRLLVWDEAHFIIDYDQNLHTNCILKLSIPLMNQLCYWLSKVVLQRLWISLMQAVQTDHWWHWSLRQEFENTLAWNKRGLFAGYKHCSQALRSQ